MNNLSELIKTPGVWGVVGDPDGGKSMMTYEIISDLKEKHHFNLWSYGLRVDIGDRKIYSVEELERIRDSVVVCDEFFTLFDLDDRRKRRSIENTIRLVHHNNNILILIGLPENYKKFISAKLNVVFFKRCTLSDFINGSRIKNICTAYKGPEMGSSLLNLKDDEALLFDGKHYNKFKVNYRQEYDTKAKNRPIFRENKNVQKIDPKNVLK